MWSTSAGGHLMKVVNLTGFTVHAKLHGTDTNLAICPKMEIKFTK